MGLIRVLDEIVSSQIAAGEVVERPQSVVKELIENALDAQATQIDISIEEGGLKTIIVSDDGIGMGSDDAVMCFSRYATSKLVQADDLHAIRTYGFRGEALPSIASVAKVNLLTRPKDKLAATQVGLEGGRVLEIGESGAAFGTRVEIEDLFFNVPARLKFLKSPRAEASAVEHIVRVMALAKPEVGFSLRINGKKVVDARPVVGGELDDPRRTERVIECLSEEVRGWIYPFSAKTEMLEISGHLVAPLVTRRDFKGIRLFINGRAVEDRQLQQAVRVAYRTMLEIGRHPICALHVQVDPSLVDVNVHPRKLEVRFSDAAAVQGQLIRVLSEFLGRTPWLKSTTLTLPSPASGRGEIGPMASSIDLSAPMFSFNLPSPASGRGEVVGNYPLLGSAKKYTDFRVIGQVLDTFLVLEHGSNIVMLDQHAAHERVVFEKVRSRVQKEALPAQPMLFPIQISLNGAELAALDANAETLARYGIEAEVFSQDSAVLRSVPQGVKLDLAERLLRDALDELVACGRPDVLQEFSDHICAQIACHSSVRKGQKLSNIEIEALLCELDQIDIAAHCPHGRPVARALPFQEVAKWFSRL